MLDKSSRSIDAVVTGTPDHMHAQCAMACMQLGKHVYVEKPLTRTAWEARLLAEAAEKYKVATQMGNQDYSSEAIRVACEIIWSGEIGDVTEVHAWHGPPSFWPHGIQKIPAPTPVPETLDWDLWLGGATWCEYTQGDEEYMAYAASGLGTMNRRTTATGRAGGPPAGGGGQQDYGFYLSVTWRGFFDFGTGLFGDWGVHVMRAAYWALNLKPEYLISVERTKVERTSTFSFPVKCAIKYEFAAREGMLPLTLYWEDSVDGDGYLPPGMTVEQAQKILGKGPQVSAMPTGGGGAARGGPRGAAPGSAPGGAPSGASGGAPGNAPGGAARGGPPDQSNAQQTSGYNCIYVGGKGYMGTAQSTADVGLLPGSRWAEYKLPNPYLTRAPGSDSGHHLTHLRDWVRACKGGASACSNFSVSGPYTEWLVLGAVASQYEGKLMWDNAKMEFSNNKNATKWIKHTYRKGWELKL